MPVVDPVVELLELLFFLRDLLTKMDPLFLPPLLFKFPPRALLRLAAQADSHAQQTGDDIRNEVLHTLSLAVAPTFSLLEPAPYVRQNVQDQFAGRLMSDDLVTSRLTPASSKRYDQNADVSKLETGRMFRQRMPVLSAKVENLSANLHHWCRLAEKTSIFVANTFHVRSKNQRLSTRNSLP